MTHLKLQKLQKVDIIPQYGKWAGIKFTAFLFLFLFFFFIIQPKLAGVWSRNFKFGT